MFGWFKKEKEERMFDFNLLKSDMHSHLLPEIDDGAKSLNNSLELIKGLNALGYTNIITTPHIFWDLYKNTPDIIHRKLEIVREAVAKENIPISVNAAAEYFLDDHFAEILSKKEKLLTIKDNYVLTEFSTMHLSIAMKEMLFDVQMAGYQPILAHPERYAYLSRNKEVFHELSEQGILFQLNILSLSGGYGKTVLELAEYLINKDLYSFIGTDMHHIGHLHKLQTLKSAKSLEKVVNSSKLLNSSL